MEILLSHNSYLLKDWSVDNEFDNVYCVLKKNIEAEEDCMDFLDAVVDMGIQTVFYNKRRLNIDISRETCGFADELLFIFNINMITSNLIEVTKVSVTDDTTTTKLITID